MERTLKLLNNFEKRNNISTTLVIHSDQSGYLDEYWEEETLKSFKTINELEEFLKGTQYEMTDCGICISPVRIVGQ